MNIRNSVKMSQSDKFEIINSEVRSLYEFCKEAGMSDEEMDLICRPLTSAVRKSYIKKWTRVGLFIVMVLALGYTVSQTESVQWHASAVGRIILIRLLPIWDWTPLYYNKCLLAKSQVTNIDDDYNAINICTSCEAVKTVERIAITSYNEVFHQHLLRGAPVIVTDAYTDWSLTGSAINLTSLIADDERLANSVPCRILTNVRIGRQPMDLEEIVSRVLNNNIPNWFVHFQNCDLRAVKSFRILAPRPYFLSPHIPPSHFNWILMSKNYDTHRYKFLELDNGLIIMSQLRGRNFIKLHPRSPCEEDCFTMNVELNDGETLVLANSLWEFEYLPGKEGDNVAIITETDWMES